MDKILVRAPNWVGDGVMATPALSALRSHYPKAQMTVLAKPAVCALLTNHPAIDCFWVYEDPGRHTGIRGFIRLVAALRKERFDKAFLIQNAFEAALIAFLADIPERIGYDTDGRGILLTKALPRKYAPRHQRDAFYVIGIAEGVPQMASPPSPSLFLKDEEISAAWERLSSLGISPSDFIVGISPGTATGSAKCWMPDRFAEVSDQLVKRRNAKILILGGPNDRSAGETVLRAMQEKGVLLAGAISLREMMAMISLCRLCLSNDSGPMHIASTFGIPYIALFGPMEPAAAFPGGKGRFIYHRVNCSPCYFSVCPVNHHCMTAISVDEVLDIALEIAA